MPKVECSQRTTPKAETILTRLEDHYPEATTSLKFKNPFQLLVATILSAQTTDEQVNKITDRLFADICSPEEMAGFEPGQLEPYLKSCGLYRHKSRYLVETARLLVKNYNSRVPERFEELIKLPGVGRKTANVILSNAFNQPALAVDTHVFRVSRRLGLACGKTTDLVEEELKKVVPKDKWSRAHHWLITHGRQVCNARSPKCSSCFLVYLCPDAAERGILNDLGKIKS